MSHLPAALSAALSAGRTILVPNRQRAAAVRLAWAASQVADGRTVWGTPDVLAWDAWLTRELQRARHRAGEGRVLLNASQELELWRRVLSDLGEEPAQAALYAEHAAGIARAAAIAREHGLSWRAAVVTEEAALLARALDSMDVLCEERGCVATSLLRESDLVALAPAPLLFAGFEALTPRQAAVADAFRRAGVEVDVLTAGAGTVSPRAQSFPDAADEAAAIARWCRERLRDAPASRLLVVCADTRVDSAGLHEAIAAAVGVDAVALEGGEPLAAQGLVRAALAVVALGAGEVAFASLSAVLLSPYVAFVEPEARLRLELALRERVPERGSRDTLLGVLDATTGPHAAAAAALAALVRASARLREWPPLTPLDWVRRWGELLDQAGHPGTQAAGSAEQQAWRRWQAALEEFASLGSVLPPMGAAAALARLEALLARSEHRAATGDAPVTVTTWRGDPILRYDGIWVAGLSESQWPEAPRLDPFIPVPLQRQAGLPAASTATRLASARLQRRAWEAAARHALYFTFARADGDIDQAASVLLHDLTVTAEPAARRPGTPHGQAESRPLEPSLPVLAPERIAASAGSRLPELQRECPFRAQAELRLGATALATPRVGIDPPLRGQLLHRALQRLWQRIGTRTRLHSRPLEGWGDAIEESVEAAFAQDASRGAAPPTPRQQAREKARCHELLAEALALEWERTADFTVESSEERMPWTVAGARLRLRVDRIDRLADGSRLVIDYKSGRSARLDLLGDAARPVQLLAYLDAVGGDVAGLALMKLSPQASTFEAVEDGRAGLPRPARSRVGGVLEDWPARVAAWRTDVEGLVAQHLAGDARVLPLKGACVHCPLPALCRIDSEALQDALDTEGEEAVGDDD